MKLFLVIYISGKVAGTVGPLPHTYEECKQKATEIMQEVNLDALMSDLEIDGLEVRDIAIACELSKVRPMIEFK